MSRREIASDGTVTMSGGFLSALSVVRQVERLGREKSRLAMP